MGSSLACLINRAIEELGQDLFCDVVVRLYFLIPDLPAADTRAYVEAVRHDDQGRSGTEVDDVIGAGLAGLLVHGPKVDGPGLTRGDVELSDPIVQAKVRVTELVLRPFQEGKDGGRDLSGPTCSIPSRSGLAAPCILGSL